MNGWGPADGVFDTTQSTIDDAIDWVRHELNTLSTKKSNEFCDECGNDIPIQRQEAVPGVQFCIVCQPKHESKLISYYNRRGCKDSQLR